MDPGNNDNIFIFCQHRIQSAHVIITAALSYQINLYIAIKPTYILTLPDGNHVHFVFIVKG